MFDQRSSVRGRWWRAGVAGATVPLMVVLLAALAGAPAQAEPVDMANQQYAKTTRDGWHLTLSIDNERVNSVPNLAAALNSREGFVTLSATATATGGSAPITDSLFIAGYQLGCQTDVSSGLGIGGIASANGSVGMPSGVNVGGGLTGFVQTVIQPGVITELPMANMALGDDGRAMLDIDNIHIKADACGGGDVTIRSYAHLRISTGAAHSSFAIYGDPAKISRLKGTSMPQLRLHISAVVAVGALMLLTASPASADTPPPPGPASLPALTVPGKPTLESTDSRGTNVEIMGGEDRTLLAMPGSRLGNSPYRISQVGPTNGVRTTSGSGGVGIGSTNLAGGLEDPHGNPAPIAAPGNEGTYVDTPPAPGAG